MPDPSSDYVADYRRDGYAIVRGLFSADEIAAIGAAVDQVHAEGVAHGRSFRHGNLFYNVTPVEGGDPLVRMVQWPSYHQPVLERVRRDPRFRKPDECYRNLGISYVQTGLAIDPHTPESGCMRFLPRSHLQGDLPLDTSTEVLGNAMADDVLVAAGLSPGDAVDLVLAPGDLALWSPY